MLMLPVSPVSTASGASEARSGRTEKGDADMAFVASASTAPFKSGSRAIRERQRQARKKSAYVLVVCGAPGRATRGSGEHAIQSTVDRPARTKDLRPRRTNSSRPLGTVGRLQVRPPPSLPKHLPACVGRGEVTHRDS